MVAFSRKMQITYDSKETPYSTGPIFGDDEPLYPRSDYILNGVGTSIEKIKKPVA